MGAQGVPYSDASESVWGGRETRESALMTDAQERAEPVEPEHALLTKEERASLEHMLTDQYGIPWILSALELEITCMTDDDQQKVAMEPDLSFFLVDYAGQCVSAAKSGGDALVPCQIGIWGGRRTWYPGYWGSALAAECIQL